MEQRFLADSNTIIDYIGNRMPQSALPTLDGYFNEGFAVSIISKIEVLGFNADEDELERLASFIGWGNSIFIDGAIADKTIALRKMHRIKLPDAIIAATAIVHDLTLLSRNTNDFKNINGLKIIDPHSL
jgi:predicted nucleic acid-binding protein